MALSNQLLIIFSIACLLLLLTNAYAHPEPSSKTTTRASSTSSSQSQDEHVLLAEMEALKHDVDDLGNFMKSFLEHATHESKVLINVIRDRLRSKPVDKRERDCLSRCEEDYGAIMLGAHVVMELIRKPGNNVEDTPKALDLIAALMQHANGCDVCFFDLKPKINELPQMQQFNRRLRMTVLEFFARFFIIFKHLNADAQAF